MDYVIDSDSVVFGTMGTSGVGGVAFGFGFRGRERHRGFWAFRSFSSLDSFNSLDSIIFCSFPKPMIT